MVMDARRLQEQADAFSHLAEQVKAGLAELADLVSGGCVPAGEQLQALNGQLARLGQAYDELRRMAGEALGPEEMPAEGAPVSAYIEAAARNEHLRARAAREGLLERLGHSPGCGRSRRPMAGPCSRPRSRPGRCWPGCRRTRAPCRKGTSSFSRKTQGSS